ncbi:MAG TPA: acyl-CoA dehydrogenase family protein [Sporichthya sp.]|nr:acyl-CoA dehydrogenase family protein [Sporichthya sp.]
MPSAEERALAETVRNVLTDLSSVEQIRADLDTDPGFGATAWKALARDVGLCGLTIAEEFGGLGLGWSASNVVHQELGRALYPGPFLATSLATTALAATGSERWLPGIAAGDTVAAVALADRAGAWTGAGVTAAEHSDGWRLTGRRWFVIAGHAADLLVVLARAGAGDALFAVERDAAGLTAAPMTGMDLTRRLAVVDLVDTPAAFVGSAGAALAEVGRHLRLALSAEAAGGLEWCTATCVEYATTREQFGRIIGSFQAVAHACVDLFDSARSAQGAARWAAVAAQNGVAEAELAGHVAALRAGEDYKTHTEAGVHLLGGIGFTWEHDMHLYYRRARSAAALAGGPATHRLAIAALTGL